MTLIGTDLLSSAGYTTLDELREHSRSVVEQGPDITWYTVKSATLHATWIAWDDSNPADPGFALFATEAEAVRFHKSAWDEEAAR